MWNVIGKCVCDQTGDQSASDKSIISKLICPNHRLDMESRDETYLVYLQIEYMFSAWCMKEFSELQSFSNIIWPTGGAKEEM